MARRHMVREFEQSSCLELSSGRLNLNRFVRRLYLQWTSSMHRTLCNKKFTKELSDSRFLRLEHRLYLRPHFGPIVAYTH